MMALDELCQAKQAEINRLRTAAEAREEESYERGWRAGQEAAQSALAAAESRAAEAVKALRDLVDEPLSRAKALIAARAALGEKP